MSAGEFSIDALAFQAVAALDSYEVGVEQLVRNWPDPELYAGVCQDLDSAKIYCAAMRGMSAPWVTVLISHTELMQALWQRHAKSDRAPASCADLLADHLQTVHYLRQRCARFIGGQATKN